MIDTDQGTFANFATLRHAYLDAHNGHPDLAKYFRDHAWDPDNLHISQLGTCARKQMYDLIGGEKKYRSPDSLANRELMFWQGNIIHALTVGACDWSGILVDFEQALVGLPDGWSGTYDLVWEDRINRELVLWDGKTVRPNNFNYWYLWPKHKDRLQMQGYLRYVSHDVDVGYIEYIDRGGSNKPFPCAILADNPAITGRMTVLDNYRYLLPNLPDPLEPTYSLTYRKVTNDITHRWAAVYYGNSWECEWCDYMHGTQDKRTKEWTISESSPCKPKLCKTLVAKNAAKGIRYEDAQMQRLFAPSLNLWLKDQLLEWTEQETDVE